MIYESLKNVFGPSNCHLLQINSKSFESQILDKNSQELDPWSEYCKIRDSYTILESLKLKDPVNESLQETSYKSKN